MVNLTNHPYPEYGSDKVPAAVSAALIGISLIAWFIQSIQFHFKPPRLIILLLVSHLAIFIELILRGTLSTNKRNSKAVFRAITVLFAVGQRTIILANYDYLTRTGSLKPCMSRAIIIGSTLCVIGSGILMAPVVSFSYNSDTIDQSFRLRQASATIVLVITILFYPIWFATKTAKLMTKQAIILLIISGLTSLSVAIFQLVTSVPDYYAVGNQQELWYYIFQFTPVAIAQFTWTILHPKRSLVAIHQLEDDDAKESINNIL
jgi:hypothetical protein